jgi:hypothetical protein
MFKADSRQVEHEGEMDAHPRNMSRRFGTPRVDVMSLDDVCSTNIIPPVNFVKMDIEGAEISAFRGATRTRREMRPKLSIAVYHQYANACIVEQVIRDAQPNYDIAFVGLFMREEFGRPRPFMLHAC